MVTDVALDFLRECWLREGLEVPVCKAIVAGSVYR